MRLNHAHVIPGRGCVCGVVGLRCAGAAVPAGSWRKHMVSGSGLGWPAVVGESPVRESCVSALSWCPSSSGPVESAVNLPGPPGKPEYSLVTDSG